MITIPLLKERTYRSRESKGPSGLHPQHASGIHVELCGSTLEKQKKSGIEDEVGTPAFRERDWLGCKSETLSGSRLTACGHIRHFAASITQRRSSRLTFSPPLFSLHSNSSSRVLFLSKLHIANMGAIPEADPDEVLETKPFKFVTGKSTNPLPRKPGLGTL